jgi:hypothetical protein
MNNSITKLIIHEFTKLNYQDKCRFLYYTKYIFSFQEIYNFEFIHYNYRYIFDDDKYYDKFIKNDNEHFVISKTYEFFYLFLLIKNSMYQTSKLTNELNDKCIDIIFRDNDEKDHFKKFINVVILINLIKKKLNKKSGQKISEYNLFNQLYMINENIIVVLKLEEIINNSLLTKEDVELFFQNYTENMNLLTLFENLTFFNYDDVYHIFDII